MNSALFSIVFVFLATLYQVETRYDVSEELRFDRESQFYCQKLKSCTPGGPKVCGYDEYKPWLAQFEDICVLYKTNCNHMGRFHQVDQVVCDTRIKYDKEHPNDTFEVIHINPTRASHPLLRSTGAPTRKWLRVKLYYTLFAAFHCYKKLGCKSGGGWVCGISRGVHAYFPDKCHLHGANCLRQGVYWQISTAICNPVVTFAEALTAYYGQRIFEYSTLPTNIQNMTPPMQPRRLKHTKIAPEKSSIFTKIKDSIDLSANFSIHFNNES